MCSITEEQSKIISSPADINIAVNSCPGSGKTTTIMYRVFYLHKVYGYPLSSIAVFTYNKFLAYDMISKLPHFEIPAGSLGWCNTIHAFCYRETQNVSDLSPWLDMYRESGYNKEPLKFIIFDEYQDADPAIAEVVEVLARDRYLMIVGDERQQVYGHRGADASLLLNIKKDFTRFSLSRTFRCNKEICKFLSCLYPSYPEITSEVEGPAPTLYRYKGRSMGNPKLIELIVKIVAVMLVKYKSIAILSPIVESEKALLFINDIQSNLKRHCKKDFSLIRGNDDSMRNSGDFIITSIHKSKGREYDAVILLNVIDGKNYFDAPDSGELSKLFVACSRARYSLHLFEYLFSEYVGSLRWITDNESLMQRGPAPFNLVIGQTRKDSQGERYAKYCVDYVRNLSVDDRKALLATYGPAEVVDVEAGLGTPFCEPTLFGILVEWCLAIKYTKQLPVIDYRIYLTSSEWTQASRVGIIPDSLRQKVELVMGAGATIANKQKYLKVKTRDRETYISEDNTISLVMCDEYYRHLPEAKRRLSLLRANITKDTVKNLWWLVRFDSLTRLSLVGFETPELADADISLLINYIKSTTLLNRFKNMEHHVCGIKQLDDFDVLGETDFLASDSIVEIKCFVNETNMDDAWCQVAVYNQMKLLTDANIKRRQIPLSVLKSKCRGNIYIPEKTVYNFDKIYIFNPVKGKLMIRRLIR